MAQPLYAGAARVQQRLTQVLHVVQADNGPALRALLHTVEQAARAGCWCVGGLRYEAASALRPALQTQAASGPLAWFAVCEAPPVGAISAPPNGGLPPPLPALHWESTLSRAAFDAGMGRIHAGIAQGHYYQINYTQQLHGRADAPVDGAALFAHLQRAQPGGYAVYLDMGAQQIASVSPELFFDWHQPAQGSGHILTRPMKGTAARGATPQADAAQAQHLQTSAKERAENVMVVDMLRNDLGQIAELGSVQVPSLFDVQALPSVWQMTSDVRAQLPQGTGLLAVFEALFPCGSVTGAPKRSAMRAIAALETEPRGWYCGALGVVRPDGAGGIRATFNVPIRTVVVQGEERQDVRCGIGSGITADATAPGEWAEWRAKRAFVERVSMAFDLLETLALENGHLRHLPLHLQRMQAAAQHFGYPWQAAAVQSALLALAQAHPTGLLRVRCTLSADGRVDAQAHACGAPPAQVWLQLAPEPLPEAHSEFVRFKTSRRAHYERFAPKEAHIFDTVLWNEAGEITEGTRGNVAALIEGQWVTPALSCGLLNGIGRQVALAEGRVVEGVIRVADLPRVQQWAFVNSLRGWVNAKLMRTGSGVD